ncbi:transcriptional regulator, CarD family [Geoalkalibacter ferrihydriticus]|uniref:CarD family transcriptional regulator n=2 Tax=Geoalkalibacter ferrihydriticus TaxID=392333 RepID=A0A0C2HYD7_9BACT|nr:CarD family transcriptional regulator [Geoalkalibacter ferrihydriticus]KIH77762.1 CarD family transcriptional regulator [Geoalkalibacter ferrihydriticus DSM 17813]SDL77694.1 transcriptional regulator, CarD family [Geoalkalibacter ferrihydriticus]
MFKIGDMAVYPTQGVGVIESIEAKEFQGQKLEFYILRIVDSDMTIMVPVNNCHSVGLRCLVDSDTVDSIYGVLENAAPGGPVASWSRRQREYHDKIKSGDLFEVAAVLRDLYQIRCDKELSYGEKKVLEQAQKLLIKEIAFAQGAEEQTVYQRIEKIFH